MCGICGVFYPSMRQLQPDVDGLVRMRDRLAMRGPDAAGISYGNGYGLAHRRLAVIDLSATGVQPMKSKCGGLEIVFNGEVYNYRELRVQLQSLGYTFASSTDTEVLLYGYMEWGLLELADRVRGMFAFAILDHTNWQLHLARDPLGKKPLFYKWAGPAFIFSSLAGSIAEITDVTVNYKAVDNLLFNSVVSGNHTILEDTYRLAPGCVMTVSEESIAEPIIYWKPEFSEANNSLSLDHVLHQTEDALRLAVTRRLVADVPIGIMLSGGIDSSLVTSIAADVSDSISTFSVATQDPSRDESHYARQVAVHCGTSHHELRVTGSIRRLIPRLVGGMGEPFGDASALNLVAISEIARQHIVVALTGDGGDEGFGGYTSFLAYHLAGKLRRHLSSRAYPMLNQMAMILALVPGPLRKVSTVIRLATQPLARTFPTGWVSDAVRRAVYTSDISDLLKSYDPTQRFRDIVSSKRESVDIAEDAMWLHLLTTLPDDYLAKVDYATMAVGLEARSPFLDRDLIELAMQIPSSMRFHGLSRKAVLRQLAHKRLPSSTVDRPKRGFVTPVWLWLGNEWSDLVEEFVLGPQVERRGWFRRDQLQRLVHEHAMAPTIATGYFIWSLMILEIWIQVHLEKTVSISDEL